LNFFAQKLTRKEYLDAAIEVIAEWTGFRCVGIRILDSQGYISYESHKGFSSQFLEKENRLQVYLHCTHPIPEQDFWGYSSGRRKRSGDFSKFSRIY